MRPLLDGTILEALSDFFPVACHIEAETITQNEEGEEIRTWATVPGLEDLRCSTGIVREGARDTEQRAEDMTRVQRQRYVLLQGLYPQITPAMRFVQATGETWNILGVMSHNQGVATRMFVERIEL